jgi:hypothetical protein
MWLASRLAARPRERESLHVITQQIWLSRMPVFWQVDAYPFQVTAKRWSKKRAQTWCRRHTYITSKKARLNEIKGLARPLRYASSRSP